MLSVWQLWVCCPRTMLPKLLIAIVPPSSSTVGVANGAPPSTNAGIVIANPSSINAGIAIGAIARASKHATACGLLKTPRVLDGPS